MIKTFKREPSGHARDEHKRRKNQIGGRKTMPFGMLEHVKSNRPIARCIDDYHKTYRDTSKNIERF
jgi:hypothetical protein